MILVILNAIRFDKMQSLASLWYVSIFVSFSVVAKWSYPPPSYSHSKSSPTPKHRLCHFLLVFVLYFFVPDHGLLIIFLQFPCPLSHVFGQLSFISTLVSATQMIHSIHFRLIVHVAEWRMILNHYVTVVQVTYIWCFQRAKSKNMAVLRIHIRNVVSNLLIAEDALWFSLLKQWNRLKHYHWCPMKKKKIKKSTKHQQSN